ncbi:MAG: translation initiation factor IF-3 [Candidatus Gracilibacteria bacterium]|nr:translation initiation factor IF-3 [Candidatus Gracilibacteria bacterium]
MAQKGKRINEDIRSDKINVISATGEQLGIMSLDKALQFATEAEMDLVEVSEQDGVVLAKIMDYGKFLFKQQKNISKSKSHSKKSELKTIRLTYKIGDHDLEIRKNQALKFAKDGHPLKITLMLRGRENQYEALAQEKIKEFIQGLDEFYKVEGRIAKTGTTFNIMLNLKK